MWVNSVLWSICPGADLQCPGADLQCPEGKGSRTASHWDPIIIRLPSHLISA